MAAKTTTRSSSKSAAKSKGSAVSTSLPVRVDSDSEVRVRQIKNGFIISESGTKGKGKNKEYYQEEYFSRTNPVKISGTSPAARTSFGRNK